MHSNMWIYGSHSYLNLHNSGRITENSSRGNHIFGLMVSDRCKFIVSWKAEESNYLFFYIPNAAPSFFPLSDFPPSPHTFPSLLRGCPFLASPHPAASSLYRIRPLRPDKAVLCFLCVCSLVGGLVSGSSQGSRWVDTVGFPMGFSSSAILLHSCVAEFIIWQWKQNERIRVWVIAVNLKRPTTSDLIQRTRLQTLKGSKPPKTMSPDELQIFKHMGLEWGWGNLTFNP